MAGEIYEWYGFRWDDRSEEAEAAAVTQECPFVTGQCTKPGGVCAIRTQREQEIVAVCPKRFYGENFRFLREIADEMSRDRSFGRTPDGLPVTLAGDLARTVALTSGQDQAAIFGKGWASEVKLPAAVPGGARYSVDFVVIALDGGGGLVEFAPVEVQTIDTTGNYSRSMHALLRGRQMVSSNVGLNWENVSKRILPQLIVKGLMLQGEEKCRLGIYFACPEPVYKRIMARLGGSDRLRRIPQQPGSITFLRYEHDETSAVLGEPVPLSPLDRVTISVSDLSIAFISPQNLPDAGAYEREIERKL